MVGYNLSISIIVMEAQRLDDHSVALTPLSQILLCFQEQDDKKLGCHWWDSCCRCSWRIRFMGPHYGEKEEKER